MNSYFGYPKEQTMSNIDDIRLALDFYRELGFESLPFAYGNRQLEVGSLDRESKEVALSSLRDEIGDCHRCRLSKDRTNIVFGEGSANAKIMFVGEFPAKEEEQQARPFVGEAGQLLTRLIERMGFKREDVYITNIVKCRPPFNREPEEDEVAVCFRFLQRQIEIINPKVIMSFGKISSHALCGENTPLSKFSIRKSRGRFYEYKGIPLMPTFHPLYLLRNTKDKWLTWEDAQAVLRKLEEA